jgi:hypothetical protein
VLGRPALPTFGWGRSALSLSDAQADIRIAISPRGAAEPGRTIEEIARERRCDPLDAVCDVIIADKGATRIVVRSMSEADVRAIAADPSAWSAPTGPAWRPMASPARVPPAERQRHSPSFCDQAETGAH